MRKLVLKMSMSVDGFVTSRDGDPAWMLRGSTPDSAEWVRQTLASAGVHAIGRRLFEDWATLWPASPTAVGAAMNDIPKVVFTRQQAFDAAKAVDGDPTPAARSWREARVAASDLTEEVERLKGEDGGYILTQGGIDFARSLIAAGLIDEYRLVVLPVALGGGERLFSDDGERDLELVESTAFAGGVLANVYRPR
jgi:dihydrofolate reductase